MESIKSQIEKIGKQEVESFIKDLRGNIKNKLNGSLLSLLGLEQRYNNQYEIDHCNSRNSILIDTIRDMAKDEVSKLAKGLKIPLETSLLKTALQKELRQQISYEITSIARAKAKELAQKFVDEVTPKEIKELLNSSDKK